MPRASSTTTCCRLHHAFEYADAHWPFDTAFLASGALLVATGWALMRAGARDGATAGRRR